MVSSAANNRRNDLSNELLLELTACPIIWDDHTSYLSQLSPEVMLAIMKCMDDLSIYALAKASHRWRQLINSTVDWKQFLRTRWPLFPLSDDENGTNLSRIYDQLSVCTRERRATVDEHRLPLPFRIRSSSCFICLSETGIRVTVR